MKRKLLNTILGYLVLLLFATTQWANAQNYVPNYTFAASIGTYTPLTTGTILGTGTVDDASYPANNIGFPFVYDGVTYTTFSVNANGILAFGNSINYSYQVFSSGQNNIVVPMNEDLQGHSNGELKYDTIGTAPFRKLVVQFANWSFYSSGSTTDSLNFQIILNETSNIVQFVYGNNTPLGSDDYVQVGIRGATINDYKIRTTSTDWNTTTDATSYYDDCVLSATGPIAPISGLTYSFTPPPKAYNSSEVTMPSAVAVGPGSTNEVIARVAVNVTGLGSYLAATEIAVHTTGTTALSDIANIKVYYTGTSDIFATTTQVGATVAVPAASNLITDSVNLTGGDNYFWVVYDIAPAATLGNVIDAEVPTIKIGGINRVPSTTAPAGNRNIQSPMTFLSAAAFHPNLTKVGAGTATNEILGLRVITSSTGSAINATVFDFSALGTTDTAEISNLKLWYTGSSSTFATGNQVGATVATLPGTVSFSVTGSQSLLNDTNYFWLSYDVSSGAIIGNFIDAECSSVTIGGTPQTPSVTAPLGNREIRADYCTPVASSAANACNWGYYGTYFATTGAISNISQTNGCNGTANNYVFHNNLTLTAGQTQTVNVTLGDYTNWMSYAIFIDYNQDGVFGANEEAFNSGTSGDVGQSTGSFTIPCDAIPGVTRMRVRTGPYWWTNSPPPDGCADVGYGETDDYNINIVATPVAYTSSDAVQQTGVVSPGTSDREVLQIPVLVNGCGIAVAGDFYLSTGGSTNTADITAARLYYTGTSSVFSTANQTGFVSAPNGSFTIAANDTLETNVTNYFWLAYDVSASATLTNVIDARLDSLNVLGAIHIPSNTNPSGNIVVTAPMTFVATNITQSNTQSVGRGDVNNEVLGVMVVMSSTGAPANATQFDLSAIGTTDTAEIRNMSVWYTGNSNSFAAVNQFGSSLFQLPGTMTYTIAGTQPLLNDTNYFWVTYDVEGSALIGNAIDATCASVTIAGTPQTPSNPAPAGQRLIREAYCAPVVSMSFSCTWGTYLSAVNTYGANSNISNNSGCNGNVNNYINYTNSQTMVASQNQTITIDMGNYSSWQTYAAWIDYNQDGVFDNVTERIFSTTNTGNYGNMNGSFTIPCDALTGETRMRVRSADYWWFGSFINDACSDVGLGETEDYKVIIMATPPTFETTDALQQNAVAAPGALAQQILEIPIEVSGCGVSTITDLRFSTGGTTNTADISNAKLYKTGTSATFASTTLVGTVASPNGNFSISLTDTLVQNATNYYWLAYDVAPAATLGNALDATLDSIQVLGAYHIPSNTNPSGSSIVTLPMSYVSSAATQTDISKVGRGSKNTQVLGMTVVTSPTGAPIELTQFDLSAAGTTDTANISNLKVWYTGNSNMLDTTTQFGATVTNLPGTLTFTVTGSQALTNDTNYFWLTYDVVDTATIGNLIDAEFGSVTVAGVPNIPTVTAPVGAREIREQYCTPLISNAVNVCSWGNYYISEVSTSGATGNITNYTGCAGTANNYINYPNITLATAQNQTVNINVYVNYGTATVWIDYNQDGVFDNITERVYQPTATGSNWGYRSGSFTVPCDALTGTTRMRVRSGDYWSIGSYLNDPCSDVFYGESEDYTVTIAATPVAFESADAIQTTGTVAPGVMDQPILRVPVASNGCGVSTVTSFNFSTSGSTSTSDITSAKLYKTGTSTVFNTSNLLGTVLAPNGQFNFAVVDTLIPNQENQYWLAYDISGTATTTNLVDATIDSIEVLGLYEVPSTTAPSGNVVVTLPMSYVSSAATQNNLSKLGRGTADNEILGLMVITTSIGAPIAATQFDFTATGTTDTADIDNIKLWYTGTSSVFAATNQVGATLAGLPGTMAFNFSANVNLANDTNYFWLTYDVDGAAVLGNLVDAEVTGITIGGTPQTPSVTVPVGTREIREDYCAPLATYTSSCSNGYYLSYVGTSGAVSNLNNSSSCSGMPNYVYYNNQTLVATQSQTITLTMGDFNAWQTYTAWIDYNQDGVFDNVTERVYFPTTTGNYGQVVGTFTIPAGAPLGTTRMRVRAGDYWWFWPSSNISSSCNDVGAGETEDYNVQILPAPPPTTYVWNQTVAEDFTTPSNWTPSRNVPFANDKLVFNGGGSVSVYNVINQTVSKITVDNNTTVNMDAYSAVSLNSGDTLELTSGTIVGTNNVTVGVGYDTTTVGTILGSGKVEGIVRRWINSTTTSYNFPVSFGGNDNGVNLTYTGAPSNNGTITARFVSGAPGQTGLPLTDGAITINKVSDYGIWRLQAGNGYAGGTFTGTFNAEGTPFVNAYADLRLTRRLVNIAGWMLDGTAASTTGSNIAPVLSRTGMTLLGEFAIGGDEAVNPLPVTLTTFKAAASKGDVLTSWTTANESNNKGFVVERSVDGKNFVTVGFVAGKGNTTKTTNYNFVDAKAFALTGSQKLYYRLRQVDFNGDEHLSQVALVNNTERTTLASVETYPNPFNQNITVELMSTEQAVYTLTITDLQGKIVGTQQMNASTGINRVELNNASSWAPGVYFLNVQGNASQTIKLVKTN